jgi:5'-deoxynucleotidase YfbR-like HD superfamily hydrolase
MMPRKAAPSVNEDTDQETKDVLSEIEEDEIAKLNRMLAATLNYLSDDEVEEIDIEYLLDHTEGLREWWNRYRESNRKEIEEEIKKSLGELSLKELEMIREQIKEKQD